MQKKVLSHSLTNVQLGSEFHPGRIGLVYVLFLLLQDAKGVSVIKAHMILRRANIVILRLRLDPTVTYQSSSVVIFLLINTRVTCASAVNCT